MTIDWQVLAEGGPPASDRGKVSCVMLTRGIYRHVARALSCWSGQTYPNTELLIVHTELDAESMELKRAIEQDGRVRWQFAEPSTLGRKRQIGHQLARGRFFATWDDDDWHAPRRLELQVGALLAAGQPACVLDQKLIYDEIEKRGYCSTVRPWEGTLVCRREIPRFRIKWPNIDRGEDTPLVMDLKHRGLLVPLSRPELYVATYHGYNAWDLEHHKRTRASALSNEESARLGELLG